MITVKDNSVFALTNRHFSYVFHVSPEGILEHRYFGAPLSSPLESPIHHRRTQREMTSTFEGHAHYSLNDLPQEYPTYGRSDYRAPAFHGINSYGNSVFTLLYKSHEITADKPTLCGLPSARGGDCQTLIITLEDALLGLQVHLSYTIYQDYGVFARSVQFQNASKEAIDLQHVHSTALALPPGDYEALHLHGTWAREFNAERIKLPHGRFVIDSARGTSSSAHSPFLAVMDTESSETHGRVFASTLVYSGNFSISAETNEFENVRILAGINPFNFNWRLEAGQIFQAPEALHVFTDGGLSGMSHLWHDFVRDKISPPAFKNKARPTYLNTWEAAYFDVNEDKVVALADKAKTLGVDMLVLDDGWFKGRNDDTSSLGDWTADPVRFANGIPALAAKIKSEGLQFGLWFEPEMVNPDSDLYRVNPDWALHVPGRIPSLGRNQLTLDLSRTEVVEYIFSALDAILSCGDIDYVKWDMNRAMTEAGSSALPPVQQREVPHRYMLGLYDLLSRITAKYPNILFENCASGGNRFDLGMLSFMAQNWPSDMCDPVGRLDIIHGASYLFPMDVCAAYIGPSPNHQNGRVSSIESRYNAGALCAAQGISLNEANIDANMTELQGLMRRAKEYGDDRMGGRFDRLIKTPNEVCWQYISRDKKRVYLAYFYILSAPNLPFRRAHMRGLDHGADYVLDGAGERYSGDALMQSGMPLPYVAMGQVKADMRYMPKGDFSSHVFVFEKAAP